MYISLTNNSTVNDSHGSVRRLRERGNDPEATRFRWRDYAAGGPTGSGDPGSAGFSSPDNLVFDRARNLWVVTDISSSRLNGANEYGYHKNNAMFMVPTSNRQRHRLPVRQRPGSVRAHRPLLHPRRGDAVRQRPASGRADRHLVHGARIFGQENTYTSWWPEGNRTAGETPATPKPSTVAITRATAD